MKGLLLNENSDNYNSALVAYEKGHKGQNLGSFKNFKRIFVKNHLDLDMCMFKKQTQLS